MIEFVPWYLFWTCLWTSSPYVLTSQRQPRVYLDNHLCLHNVPIYSLFHLVVCNLGCHVGIECSLELILLNWILMKSMRMMMTHIFRTFCTYVFGVCAFPLHFHCWKMIKYISLISSALCVY